MMVVRRISLSGPSGGQRAASAVTAIGPCACGTATLLSTGCLPFICSRPSSGLWLRGPFSLALSQPRGPERRGRVGCGSLFKQRPRCLPGAVIRAPSGGFQPRQARVSVRVWRFPVVGVTVPCPLAVAYIRVPGDADRVFQSLLATWASSSVKRLLEYLGCFLKWALFVST